MIESLVYKYIKYKGDISIWLNQILGRVYTCNCSPFISSQNNLIKAYKIIAQAYQTIRSYLGALVRTIFFQHPPPNFSP